MSTAGAGTSTRRLSCNPSCCSVCEAREDSHGNRNLLSKLRAGSFLTKMATSTRSARKTTSLPPTKPLPVCASHTSALCSPQIVRDARHSCSTPLELLPSTACGVEQHSLRQPLLREYRNTGTVCDGVGAHQASPVTTAEFGPGQDQNPPLQTRRCICLSWRRTRTSDLLSVAGDE